MGKMKVGVIGGGAAGFFSAISAKEHYPYSEVTIFEKSSKVLSKVKISGGGRCNVTNGQASIKAFLNAYPRGRSLMKKLLKSFDNKDTMEWYESRGVSLKTENDGRVFPKSDSSQSIIDCLFKEINNHNIQIKQKEEIVEITPLANGFRLKSKYQEYTLDRVIIASGGSSKLKGLKWLADLGYKISPPVPSLFTFNMPKNPITTLMGVVATDAAVKIQGTKLRSSGPILITHWGMSGPAVLKLSSQAARELEKRAYNFKITVNWTNLNEMEVIKRLNDIISLNPKKQLSSFRPFDLPDRLWKFLLERQSLSKDKRWGELGKKGVHKLNAILTNDEYHVLGKTTFKEEFVTCGGISIENINISTMESKIHKGLFFAGEVLDVDGITGGYNFQAAWSSGYIAGKLANL